MIRHGFRHSILVLAALGAVACGSDSTGGRKDYGSFPPDDSTEPGEMTARITAPAADSVVTGPMDVTIVIDEPALGEVTVTLVAEPGKNAIPLDTRTVKAGGYTYTVTVDSAEKLPDGKRTLRATAASVETGSDVRVDVKIVVDNLAPEIAFTSPAEGDKVQSDFVPNIAVKDSGTGVVGASVRVDGEPACTWPPEGTTTSAALVKFDACRVSTTTWKSGEHTIQVTAQDNAGHSSEVTRKIRYAPGASFETTGSAPFVPSYQAALMVPVRLGAEGAQGTVHGLLLFGAQGARIAVRNATNGQADLKPDLLTLPVARAASGDVDGDGLEDLVMYLQPSGTELARIVWFLQGANGAFGKQQGPLPTPGNAPVKAITLADLNGDGLLDMAMALEAGANSAGIALAKADAEQKFAGFDAVTPVAGADSPTWIAVAKVVKDDTRPALVLGREGLATITVVPLDAQAKPAAGVNTFLGKELTGLIAATGITIAKGALSRLPDEVVLADVGAHLLVRIRASRENVPKGVIEIAERVPTGQQPARLVTAELDGDGVPDVVTTARGSNVVQLCRGTLGTEPSLATDTVVQTGQILEIAVLDWDGDDDQDIVGLRADGLGLVVVPRTADLVRKVDRYVGTLATLTLAQDPEKGLLPFAPSSLAAGNLTLPLLTSPGAKDVVVMASDRAAAAVFATDGNTGLPQVLAWPQVAVDKFLLSPRALAKVRVDRFTPAPEYDAVVFTSGHVAPPVGQALELTTASVVRFDQGEAQDSVTYRHTPIRGGDAPLLAATGEFVKDGIPDLVTVAQFPNPTPGGAPVLRLQIFEGQADGTFVDDPALVERSVIEFGEGERPSALLAAQVRVPLVNIGKPEGAGGYFDVIVAVPERGAFSVYFTLPNGTFLQENESRLFAVGAGVKDLAAGFLDVNMKTPTDQNKHLLDVVSVTADDVVVSYSVDNGDQSLTTSTNVKNVNFGAPYALGHKGRDPVAARIADVNADGWADIVVLNQGDSSVAVYVNRGNRTFDAPVVIPVGTGPVAMDVTDLDGDTCPDIVTSDSVGRTLTLLRNLVNCRDQ